jgi:hypothetical protein
LLNETYVEAYIEKQDALSPLLLNFALEYAIRKIQIQVGLKLSKTHQLLVTDDVC